MSTATQPDPVALLRSLSGDEIRHRIAEIDAERAQLALLLRSVAARERAEARARGPQQGRGGRDAT